jgi:hypothetical protein
MSQVLVTHALIKDTAKREISLQKVLAVWELGRHSIPPAAPAPIPVQIVLGKDHGQSEHEETHHGAE